jgi:hypothetical protein
MFTADNRKKLIKHRQKLVKIANISGFMPSLAGLCAVSAYNLYKEFNQLGYKPRILLLQNTWCSHALIVIDKLIIDLTATQFGINKKYLIERRGKLKKIYPQFNRRKAFKDANQFLDYIRDWKSSK